MSAAVIELYNADGTEFLKRIDIKKAINMLWRQVAVVLEAAEGTIGPFPRPRSLALVHYRFSKWKYDRAGEQVVTRRAILRRDKHTCAYCGKQGASTIDHVFPRSRGGEDSWDNLVTACLRCNNVKSDRTPKEAGMKLLYEPRIPSFDEIYSWGKV